KANRLAGPQQIVKVCECQPTAVGRVIVIRAKQRQHPLRTRNKQIYRPGKELFNPPAAALCEKPFVRS
ncbi:hypothetical protein SB758_35930, partial [Burkholderia sp. SIMBA_013]